MPVLLSPPSLLVIGVGEDALSGCGEELAQLVLLQATRPDQHDGVPGVVVRQVERSRIVGKERGALFEIGADNKRPWFR